MSFLHLILKNIVRLNSMILICIIVDWIYFQMNQEKRKIFQEHFKEQQKAREVNMQKRKQLQNEKNNPQEDMLFIQKQFRNLTQEMDNLAASFKKGQKTIQDLTDHHTKMKNYYLEINYVLTSYDRQFYKETLEKANSTIFQIRKKAQPKKKFKFSRRDEDFGVKETEKAKQAVSQERKETTIAGVENKSGQKLTVLNQIPEGGSFKVMSCDNVELLLLQKTEILFLKNLKNCIIKAAVTKSTVFVDSCHNCTFDLNCHQLRIHNTFDSRFNIFVTSKAIIEDCNRVIFSPYRFQYEARGRHEIEEEKANKPNLWRDIQDFNWLKENQQSPHYVLEE